MPWSIQLPIVCAVTWNAAATCGTVNSGGSGLAKAAKAYALTGVIGGTRIVASAIAASAGSGRAGGPFEPDN